MAGGKDIEYMKTFFDSLDTDNSNSISVKEIKQFYLEIQFPEDKAEQEALVSLLEFFMLHKYVVHSY